VPSRNGQQSNTQWATLTGVAHYFNCRYDFTMEKMPATSKRGENYLIQLNTNTVEKSKDLVAYLENEFLPKFGNETRVLEVGVGGGRGLEYVKEQIKDPGLTIFALDLLKPLTQRVHNPNKNIFSIVGDVAKLPIREQSMSAINLSSVLHEGISYNQEILSGSLDIDTFLKSVFTMLLKALAKEGVLFYRDPGLQQPAGTETTCTYSPLVSRFLQRFHNEFVQTFLQITKDKISPRAIMKIGALELVGSAHYHREIQRHLITYLDLATRQIRGIPFKELLHNKTDNFWNNANHVLLLEAALGDEFIYDSWFKREGSEIYTYRSREQLARLLNEVRLEVDFNITASFDINRAEYTHFLQSISDTELSDSKQCMIIKRK
jgi:SAM-dependent methyltransferase